MFYCVMRCTPMLYDDIKVDSNCTQMTLDIDMLKNIISYILRCKTYDTRHWYAQECLSLAFWGLIHMRSWVPLMLVSTNMEAKLKLLNLKKPLIYDQTSFKSILDYFMQKCNVGLVTVGSSFLLNFRLKSQTSPLKFVPVYVSMSYLGLEGLGPRLKTHVCEVSSSNFFHALNNINLHGLTSNDLGLGLEPLCELTLKYKHMTFAINML